MPEPIDPELHQRHSDHRFRSPTDLEVTPTPIKRILIVGSCFGDALRNEFKTIGNVEIDYIASHAVSELPDEPARPAGEYDFQIIVPPLHYFMPEAAYLRIRHDDEQSLNDFFDESSSRLIHLLDGALAYNKKHGLLTFVANFMKPQQNSMGRLLPKYTLSNPAYFVERLNQCLTQEMSNYRNAYLLDLEGIACSFGKRYMHNEMFELQAHGGIVLHEIHHMDSDRIEPPASIKEYYDLRTDEFYRALWHEVIASFRTIHQIDSVKLVVVDLDDTLWRGTVAEGTLFADPIGGWPRAVVEALLYLKKRGVLLAIISKNDREKIEAVWDDIFNNILDGLFKGFISLDDFSSVKINWASKDQNMAEILAEVNLLPKNVVFVDDNPRERALIKTAFPEIRVLGSHPYYLKRILLWSGETQVPYLTDESGHRTEMIQAQVKRKETQRQMSRTEFLDSLNLSVRLFRIADEKDIRFARAFELLNKTNQFNTTGKRWRHEDIVNIMTTGVLYAFNVEDKYVNYGLTGLAIVTGSCIQQFVMSCRVVGLDAEIAAVSAIESELVRQGYSSVMMRFTETESNGLCRELHKKIGYKPIEGLWIKTPLNILPMPEHVSFEWLDAYDVQVAKTG